MLCPVGDKYTVNTLRSTVALALVSEALSPAQSTLRGPDCTCCGAPSRALPVSSCLPSPLQLLNVHSLNSAQH